MFHFQFHGQTVTIFDNNISYSTGEIMAFINV